MSSVVAVPKSDLEILRTRSKILRLILLDEPMEVLGTVCIPLVPSLLRVLELHNVSLKLPHF